MRIGKILEKAVKLCGLSGRATVVHKQLSERLQMIPVYRISFAEQLTDFLKFRV